MWRLVLLLLAAAPAAAQPTLHDALGGTAGIIRIVGHMLDGAVADPRIAASFDNINLARLRGRIAEHICELADGPCTYRGPTMRGAHAGLGLRERHFNALVEQLQLAMDREGVPFRTQNRLLARLAPLQRDMLER